MLKGKKANPKGVQKFNKNIKNVVEANPKQKKQQMEKVKRLAKALELERTRKQKLAIKEDSPDVSEQSEVESNEDQASDAVEQSEVESDEEDNEALDAVEQSEVESDEEDDDAKDDAEQSAVESDEEEDNAPDAVKQSKVGSAKNDTKPPKCVEGVGHTVLVSNLPAKTDRVQLVTLFAPYGKVMSILFSNDKGVVFTNLVPEANIRAYIVLDSIEAANKALGVDGTVLNGQRLIVKKPHEPFKVFSKTTEADTVVFVTNLKTNEKQILENFFSSCGKIRYINFLKKDDKVKAFVCFISPEAVDKALKLNGFTLQGGPVGVFRYSPNFKPTTPTPLSRVDLKNLDKDEFKERMLKIGQQRIEKMKNHSFQRERKHSQFRGVRSTGIRKVRNF